MFWGLILKSNKKYTQTLEKSFHLSKASLDISTADNEPVQVMYTHDNNSYLLCTLQKGKFLDCSLDLNFQEGDNLCFSTKGNGIVHLTGYLIPDDDDFGEFEDAMDDESMDEEAISDLREKLEAGKKKSKEAAKAGKKKVPVEESEDEEDDDDSDAELDQTADNDDESGEEEEDDEEDDDEDEEDEDSEEEQVQAPPAKQQKLDPHAKQNGKKQNGLENGDKQGDKKQKQKEKGQDGKIQKLQGGLLVQDLKVGTGAEAKPGKKVQVYYEGRLKSNNKVFDATKNGPGFKFTLGKGDVIKGWDLGITGLKVGGKRRLICPPQLAYGAKGNPPVIPQNSTLVFDVELKNVF